MNRAFFAALLILSISDPLYGAEPPTERFEDIRARARQMGETAEGKAYEKRFSEAVAKSMQAALEECTKDTKPPYAVTLVFVIGSDGATKRIVAAPEQKVSACVAAKLGIQKLPAPRSPNGWCP